MQIPVFGLANLGNSCYFNSTMQCLLATVPLRRVYLRSESQSQIKIPEMKNPDLEEKVDEGSEIVKETLEKIIEKVGKLGVEKLPEKPPPKKPAI